MLLIFCVVALFIVVFGSLLANFIQKFIVNDRNGSRLPVCRKYFVFISSEDRRQYKRICNVVTYDNVKRTKVVVILVALTVEKIW